MPAGRHMRNTPSTTDIYHRQPSLSPANSKATHILNKDGTKLIAVPSRKVSNPDSRSLSNISNSSNSNSTSTSNFIQNSTTAANDYSAQIPDPLSSTVPSASMDYPHNASSNNVGGKKKKKKKGKQQQQQQQQQQPSTLSNNHNHSHDHGDHGHKGHRHDDYYDEPRYSRSNGPTSPNHRADQYQRDFKASMHDYDDHPPELVDPEDEEEYFSGPGYDDDDEDSYTPPIPTAPAPLAGKKKNKKKKKKGVNSTQELYQNSAVSSGGNLVGASKKKDRIWNTSTNEERERIKDFWLSLGEEERRSLVKVEKEAVLRKMKEQQKHSCSCGVCGRKRTAIEEELEVLYDAYYEELEQYAHQQQNSKYAAHSQSPGTYSAARIPPPPPPGPPPGNHVHPGHHHQGHRVEELDDEEFDDDDDDEYDDDDDDILDEPLPENDPRPDFFNFGNSLTVRGGILTVADDLLKNDGKKFIEMMEQLAERRMQREEEANAVATGHTSMNMSVGQNHIGHTHSQPQEYEDDEEYDEEEEDEEEYDEEEEDEPDTMTEEQRMEEGRKMFQIFAARMFEQRVLTAYREKVARERQDKLLEELDEEDQLRAQREEKKAKEKEKKKERRRLQKLAKEDERKKREAEKAEEEAKQRAIEDKKAEEVRRRKEEQRMKREAEKRAQEEERRRKDEERKKRLEEERERDAERERKRKENLDRERKRKEEFAKKAKEEKEAREKEVKEKRDREDRERKEREAKAKKELMERERIKKEEEAKAKAEIATVAAMVAAAATAKRPPVSIQTSIPVPHHHHHHHHHHHGVYNSPHLSVATPAMPKQLVGNSPARTRNASQQGSMQGSVASSPKTPQATPRIGSSASPNTPILQQNTPGSIILPNKLFQFPPHMPTSPLPHHIAPPPGVPPPENGFHMMNQMGMNGPSPIQPFLSGIPQRQPFGNGIPMYPPTQMPLGSNPQYRGFAAPNGMPMQVPATLGMRPMQPQGRGIFMGELAPSMHQLPPGVPLGVPPGSPFIGNRVEPVPIPGVHPHTRALSGSFEPIQRPTPIQRPSSVAPPRNLEDGLSSVDELSKVMGSRALLEDDEEDSMLEAQSPNRRGSSGIGFSPRPTRGLPAASPLFMDPTGHMGFPTPSWSNPAPLGTPLGNPLGNISNSLPNSAWSGAGWSETDAARSTFNRRRANRHDQIRSFATAKCRDLGGEKNNFIEISTLHRSVEQAAPELVITIKDLTDVLDMEGEILNGGGNFVTTYDTNGRILVRFEEDEKSIDGSGIYQAPGAPIGPHNHHPHPGEIGSPTDDGYAPPFKTVVGPPPGIAANGFPSGSEKLW